MDAYSVGVGAFPLMLAATGERVRVVAVGGGQGTDRKLSDLGLTTGCVVTVVSRGGAGSMVVARGDMRLANPEGLEAPRACALEDHCSGLVTIMTLGSSGSILSEKPSLRARPSIGAFSLSTSPQISWIPRRWQHSTISSRSRRPRPWPFKSERTAPAYSARAPSGSAKTLIIPRIAGSSA